MKNWFVQASNCSKRLTSVHFLFNMPVVYRPHPLYLHADATAHAQAQCWKGSSGHKIALPQSVALLRYSGYRARGVCALQSSSSAIVLDWPTCIFHISCSRASLGPACWSLPQLSPLSASLEPLEVWQTKWAALFQWVFRAEHQTIHIIIIIIMVNTRIESDS